MTKTKVLDKLKLMHDYADNADLRDALETAIGAIGVIDQVLHIVLDMELSDEAVGGILRTTLLTAYMHSVKEKPDET